MPGSVWTPVAESDLDDIWFYISLFDPRVVKIHENGHDMVRCVNSLCCAYPTMCATATVFAHLKNAPTWDLMQQMRAPAG